MENPAETETCPRCGYSISLSRIVWPEVPKIEVPRASETLGWPQRPTVEPPAPPTAPPAPSVPTVEQATGGEAAPGSPLQQVLTAVTETPPGQVVTQAISDAEMAYQHVSRGFEAIRQGRLEQARWEFEQARDLAEDSKLLRLVEAQLKALIAPPEK